MYFKAAPNGKRIGSTIYFSNCHSQGDKEHEEFASMVILSLEGLNRRTLYIFRHENLKMYYRQQTMGKLDLDMGSRMV